MSDEVFREVDALLKEREKYDGWLERLETSRTAATERAYERVRSDYQKRLQEVLAKLRAHSDTVLGKLQETEKTVVALEEQRNRRAEELDEARLRRSVGEYSDEGEWHTLEGGLVNSLQQTEEELAGVRAEIDKLQDILSVVQQAERPKPPPAPEAAPPPAPEAVPPPQMPVPEPAPPVGPPPGVAPAAEFAPEPPAPPEPPMLREEPAAEPTPVPAAPPPPKAPQAPPPQVAEEGISLGELVMEDGDLEGFAVDTEPGESQEQAAAEPPPPAPDSPGTESVGDELAFLESLSLSGSDESESFSFLEQHGSGTPQTIICPHCSAANDPAEWYCTECGEELPAE